jgi:pyridinium-3,5-biscarboxylic acid mononucleotide synthase
MVNTYGDTDGRCGLSVKGVCKRERHGGTALRASQVIIVISGGDGALVPVVAGLVKAPIIAVPTSTGYGAAKEGFTALYAALCSSSPGVGVQNIDNGFGAAMYARRIMRMAFELVQQARESPQSV